jgi:hypothetical protein
MRRFAALYWFEAEWPTWAHAHSGCPQAFHDWAGRAKLKQGKQNYALRRRLFCPFCQHREQQEMMRREVEAAIAENPRLRSVLRDWQEQRSEGVSG